jgi:hypothetical protein
VCLRNFYSWEHLDMSNPKMKGGRVATAPLPLNLDDERPDYTPPAPPRKPLGERLGRWYRRVILGHRSLGRHSTHDSAARLTPQIGLMLARIGELVSTAPPGEKFREQHARWTEARALQRVVAEAFGARHGWKLAQTDFGPRVLAKRRKHAGYYPWQRDWWPGEFGDHLFCYRSRDGRAAGAVAHLYGDAKGVEEWAAEIGLTVSFPSEISWWYPHQATMVLYEPADVAGPKGIAP